MFTIANTDLRWFEQQRNQPTAETIVFWTPTDWSVKSIEEGSRVYFMLKRPIRLIGGYGDFNGYKVLTISEAWREYGLANGVVSRADFFERVTKYAEK